MASMQGLSDKFSKKLEKKKTLRDSLIVPETAREQDTEPAEVSADIPNFAKSVQQIQAQPDTVDVRKVKQRTEEREKIKEIAKAPELQKPEDFDKVMQRISSISSSLEPAQKEEFEARRASIQKAKEAAQKQFSESKDTNQWLQVAETLGHALVQLGAGAYGLKHNVDLSGIKFNKNDWSKNIDRAERDLDRKLGIAQGEERTADKAENAITRKLSEDANFRKRAILQNFMAEQQSYKQQTLQAQRLAEQATKDDKTLSVNEKAHKRQAQKELQDMVRKQERKVKLLDKALGEAHASKEGEKGGSLDKVAKVLGGELGAEFRKDIKTPVSIFGIELWQSADEGEAPRVVKGYLDQAKAALEDMKAKARGVVATPAAEQTPEQPEQTTGGPKAGDVVEGYRFKGGDPANQANWEQVK